MTKLCAKDCVCVCDKVVCKWRRTAEREDGRSPGRDRESKTGTPQQDVGKKHADFGEFVGPKKSRIIADKHKGL